jgi:cell division protein ZapA (FtsZ GTPase activity inhibitor)
MVVTTVMTMLCLAAIAFNVRFLVALHRERSTLAKNQAIRAQLKHRKPFDRAA